MTPKKLLITSVSIALLLFCGMPLFAQKSRQQLEKEKKENVDKMGEIRAILKQTSSQKKVSLGQLRALNQQINTLNRKIELLNDDLSLMDNELAELDAANKNLNQELNKLKTEYASMIYAASKRNTSLTQLSFLFAAPTFNQFVIRYKYLQQYSEARKKQIGQMKNVQNMLVAKQKNISTKKKDQQSALTTRVSETKNLEKLKTVQNTVVKELSGKESELRSELADVKRANDRLESNIVRLIEREIRERREREKRDREVRERIERDRIAKEKLQRERERAEKKDEPVVAEKKEEVEPKIEKKADVVPPPVTTGGMTEEEFTLASSFAASKMRLPWPVRSGFISEHFGIHKHPTLERATVENMGVDIQTNVGEAVRSVYDGVVMDVTNITGMNSIVAIQHGDFYTIYAKLKSVSVREGQKIKAREAIGTVATDKDGISEMQFQIWKDTNKLNPEKWLAPR